MEHNDIIARVKKKRDQGYASGFLWASNDATLEDLDRIYDAGFKGWEGIGALCNALRMTESEVQTHCFNDQPWSLAFADGFTRGALGYWETLQEDYPVGDADFKWP